MANARRAQLLLTLVQVLSIMLSCAGTAFALDPGLDITQYAHTAWTGESGAVKGNVRAIVQTSDGYIWLATEFGLVRFDGVRFVAWSPPRGQSLPSSNIRSLLTGRDGTLWIGTLEGLASWKDGKLNQYPQFPRQNVLSLLEDREGVVWAGTFGVPKGNLCAIRRGDVECYGEDGSLGQWAWSLYEDADGRVWAGAETGLWRWKPGPPKRYAMPHPIETPQALVGAETGGGVLAVGEGVWQLSNEKIEEFPFAAPPGRVTAVSLFRDRDGGLWVGTLQRGLLHVYRGKTTVFAQSDGLSSDHVLSFFEDREENIWVGTTNGLDRFRQTAVYSISVKQGISSPSVWSVVAAHDGSVWLSTLDGLNRWNNGHVTIYRPRSAGAGNKRERGKREDAVASHAAGAGAAITEIGDPAIPDKLGSLYEDERGGIWVSSPDGLVRFEAGRFSKVKGVPGGWVNAITGDTRGGVWISYQDQGLVHWLGGKVMESVPWSKFGRDVTAAAVAPDPVRGGLWLGFFQGGLVHFRDGQVRASYGNKEGLGGGRVMGLQLAQDGTLWAATEGGLSRLKDGHVITLSSANGLPCDGVHWGIELEESFWVYTPCGLLRIPGTELEKWASDPKRQVQFTLLDSSDGVRSHALLTGYSPRVSKSSDGKLWFAHFEELSVVDPHHLLVNQIAPPVRIEQITADGKTYNAAGALRLPPRVRDLAIDYTALSFATPEKVRFRFLLEGQDNNWREVLNDRRVQYSNLPPGNYRFRVRACNNSGVWNEAGSFVDFYIAPAYYQTVWFRALCVAAVLAMLWGLYQLRLQRMARQFHIRLEERVGERTRIARDLHDTLLQSFQGIVLLLQGVCDELAEGPTKRKLASVVDNAAEAVIEGRDAVQGLRASTIERNDLALAIKTLSQELGAGAPTPRPEVSVQVEGAPRNLNPILRDEVYRIAGEAMRNAFRHANAQRVEVEIRYARRELSVRVRDDGKGMDPKLLSKEGLERHFGLRGMRERAELAGGRLTVWSELRRGTEVQLTIPGTRAYQESPDGERTYLAEKVLTRLFSRNAAKKG